MLYEMQRPGTWEEWVDRVDDPHHGQMYIVNRMSNGLKNQLVFMNP